MDFQTTEKVHTLQVKCFRLMTYCNGTYRVCREYARSCPYQFSCIFLQ